MSDEGLGRFKEMEKSFFINKMNYLMQLCQANMMQFRLHQTFYFVKKKGKKQ